MKIPQQTPIYMRYLHQHGGMKISDIVKQYPQFAERSIYRHCKKEVNPGLMQDRRKYNKGRPRKLNSRDERKIIREIPRFREQFGNTFTAKTVKYVSGLTDVSKRTVRWCLNKHKYYYCTKRCKGIVTAKDCRKRKKFASTVTNTLRSDFWTNSVSFYFDGVSFIHKYNLLEEVRHCKSKAWRLRSEGLSRTDKGKKEGTGGRSASFLVGISYKKGLVMCTQCFGKLYGESFSKTVKKDFTKAFRDSINPKNKLFLQDGDPIQNRKKS